VDKSRLLLSIFSFGVQYSTVGHATLKMLRRKSKTHLYKQERNTQNAIALLNYLKRIVRQQLMLRTEVFTKIFSSAKIATATLLYQKFLSQVNS
jgi:hypothetical protein